MNWIFYTGVLWIMYQNLWVPTLPIFYFVSKPQCDHRPSKLLQQLEIKWHWRRQAHEAQSIPLIRGPGKKLYLAVVSLLFWLYFSLPLLSASLLWWTWGHWELTQHCYSSNTPTWRLPPTHDTNMDAGCFCWEMALVSSLLALTMLVAFYRLVFRFFFFKQEISAVGEECLRYTTLHYILCHIILHCQNASGLAIKNPASSGCRHWGSINF